MKRGRFCFTAAAVCLMVFGLSISAQAKTTYRLEITNQYDTDGTSRDDNDKDRVHPLEPDVEVSEGSSDGDGAGIRCGVVQGSPELECRQ